MGTLWVTYGAFCAFVFPVLPPVLPDLIPAAFLFANPFVSAPAAALLVFATVSLLLTSFTDPGIIPRCQTQTLIQSMPLEVKDKMHYCPTCNVIRPSRTKHCRRSDACVREFDHFCPWTGSAVGVRNYRYFLWFTWSVFLSCALVFAATLEVFLSSLSAHKLVLEILCPVLMLWTLFTGL
jgi:hypothetical protein